MNFFRKAWRRWTGWSAEDEAAWRRIEKAAERDESIAEGLRLLGRREKARGLGMATVVCLVLSTGFCAMIAAPTGESSQAVMKSHEGRVRAALSTPPASSEAKAAAAALITRYGPSGTKDLLAEDPGFVRDACRALSHAREPSPGAGAVLLRVAREADEKTARVAAMCALSLLPGIRSDPDASAIIDRALRGNPATGENQ